MNRVDEIFAEYERSMEKHYAKFEAAVEKDKKDFGAACNKVILWCVIFGVVGIGALVIASVIKP